MSMSARDRQVMLRKEALADLKKSRTRHAGSYLFSMQTRLIDTIIETMEEHGEYERAIIEAVSPQGDDRCWMDLDKLAEVLHRDIRPRIDSSRPEPVEMLANCCRFVMSLQNPDRPYHSPQTEIRELKALLREIYAGAQGPLDDRLIWNKDRFWDAIAKAGNLLGLEPPRRIQ